MVIPGRKYDFTKTAWWFGTKKIFFVIYGMSSFPLTNSYFSRWLKHVKTTYFPYIYILGIIIPNDFHIFQRGRYTTNQFMSLIANLVKKTSP